VKVAVSVDSDGSLLFNVSASSSDGVGGCDNDCDELGDKKYHIKVPIKIAARNEINEINQGFIYYFYIFNLIIKI
jgi:hypothetical protein